MQYANDFSRNPVISAVDIILQQAVKDGATGVALRRGEEKQGRHLVGIGEEGQPLLDYKSMRSLDVLYIIGGEERLGGSLPDVHSAIRERFRELAPKGYLSRKIQNKRYEFRVRESGDDATDIDIKEV